MMKYNLKKHTLILICTFCLAALLSGNAAADYIEFNGLIDSNVSSGWTVGESINVSAHAPGMKLGSYHLFQEGTVFNLTTSAYSSASGTYTGYLSVANLGSDLVYLTADFNDLQIMQYGPYIGFNIGSLFNFDGSIIDGSVPVSLGVSGGSLTSSRFSGTIYGNGLIANPEPTTFLLLGVGLIGLAGVGRRKMA